MFTVFKSNYFIWRNQTDLEHVVIPPRPPFPIIVVVAVWLSEAKGNFTFIVFLATDTCKVNFGCLCCLSYYGLVTQGEGEKELTNDASHGQLVCHVAKLP